MRTLPLLLAGVVGLTAACRDAAEPIGPQPGNAIQQVDATANVVPGHYIVLFRNEVADPPGLARRLTAAHGGTLRFTYQHAIRGFAAALPDAAVAALRRNPQVRHIEPDQVVTLSETQSPATWGLDRVDQADLPLTNSYTYGPTGGGVAVYIIDTGIRRDHADFGGRALSGFDAVTPGGQADDCNGHGTHVAGTVGGTTWGVAKGVTLHAVRVLDCSGSGTYAGVIAGIDWVTEHHASGTPAVANMSLGGPASTAVDDAVRNSIADGVVYALAAGNGDPFFGFPQDACGVTPARVTQALTVGATDQSDNEGSFSNYGACVDLLAPGVAITSAWNTGANATRTISGTSMATPHVAGAAALYLDANPSATPAGVHQALVANATMNTITLNIFSSSFGTANRMLYTGFIGGGGGGGDPPANAPPTAAFSHDCSGLTCTFDGGTSSDDDGSVVSYDWTFGDGSSAAGETASHTFGTGGDYTVTLTVRDDDGAPDAVSQTVSVSAPSGGTGIALQATGYKVKGTQHADLTWSGATGSAVDIRRDGNVVDTTPNDQSYTHASGIKGGGSAEYRICEAGTTTCSSGVTVTF